MTIPYFFIPSYQPGQNTLTLEEESSKHIHRVLRMKEGESLNLVDGKGHLLKAVIAQEDKKNCRVNITGIINQPPDPEKTTIGISLLKNSNRFEWFLEKATEIGITEIIPLLCERTEKQQFRIERMKAILVSAMLQSKQAWLPELQRPVSFMEAIAGFDQGQKFIAHCVEEKKIGLAQLTKNSLSSRLILIGPEGDFTNKEIESALLNGFLPVSLGETRLRSETAAVVAATLLKIS
jgi:16S rRNA (uracil1498-N3)-methyltransferase